MKPNFMSRVPTIDLPKFDGNLREALDILKNLEITPDNYDIAWDLLNDAYENNTILITQHVQEKVSISELPTFDELKSFLNERVKKAVTFNKHNTEIKSEIKPNYTKSHQHRVRSLVSNENNRCPYCLATHYINQCSKFLSLTPEQRFNEARSHKLCVNCLKAGHNVKSCKSSFCKICQR
nr:unnamed protein product [Callosobruchus analis]